MFALKVYYQGELVGVVSQINNSNYCVFRYDNEFIKKGIELCPLLMPLNKTNYLFENLDFESFKGLPPLLADSLPDKYGTALLFAYQKMYGKATLSSLEALSYIGKRGMGALEFVPSLHKNELDEQKTIEIESLIEVAKKVLSEKENISFKLDEALLKDLISVGSSIGGARAKAIVAIDREGHIKSGQIGGLKNHKYAILKFDGLGADLTEEKNVTYYTRLEYAYYLMARDCGIEMTDSNLIKSNGKYHFLTNRFDRDINGNKIHMLSLSGLAGFDFRKMGTYSYEEVATIIRQLGSGHHDLKQLYTRMVFNVINKNHDDHVNNISFIMDKDGQFHLSPAYDLTYSYNPQGEWTRSHQMSINGKVDQINKNDLLLAGKTMGLSDKEIQTIIHKVNSSSKQFLSFSKLAQLPKEVANQIYQQLIFLE